MAISDLVRKMKNRSSYRCRADAALVRDGEKLLEEGITGKPGDIDMVFVNGYGFPRHSGSPMYCAGKGAAAVSTVPRWMPPGVGMITPRAPGGAERTPRRHAVPEFRGRVTGQGGDKILT